MLKYHENVFYGTLKECVDELYKLIDFEHKEIPRVSYSASTTINAETAYEAYTTAEGWFGFTDVGDVFDCDTISLMFAHYGGGGIECLELYGEDEELEKELIMQRIGNSTDSCGYGVLEPDDWTVFELE